MSNSSVVRRYTKGLLLFAALVGGCSLINPLSAQGNLLVTPKRVVFEGNKRSENLSIVNTGKDTARYAISFVQIRMKEDGSFENITTPDSLQYFADKNLRFFPRNIVLAPNESQTVKVQCIKTNELADGEYRSHLYLRSLPAEQPLGEKEQVKDSTGIAVRIIPVFGISLPVIIRKGINDSEADLANLSLQVQKDTMASVRLSLIRDGNMSIYGDISVDHVSPEGEVTRVGAMKGVAVYTPLQQRNISLQLNSKSGVNYRKGALHIIYSYQADRVEKLAQRQINL